MSAPEPRLPPSVAGPAFLRDGTEVWIRPVQADDRELVHAFVNGLSMETLALRYFAAVRPSVAEEEIIATSSASDRLCLLVLGENGGATTILGVGEYARTGPGSTLAELGLLVTESYRGRGVASLLLTHLEHAARAFRILRFVACIRAGNSEALELFSRDGLQHTAQRLEDETDVVFPIGASDGSDTIDSPSPVTSRTEGDDDTVSSTAGSLDPGPSVLPRAIPARPVSRRRRGRLTTRSSLRNVLGDQGSQRRA